MHSRKEKLNTESFHPAVLYELAPGDEGYAKGARFCLDQLDGGQYFFADRPDAELFMAIHGFNQANESEMIALRTTLRKD